MKTEITEIEVEWVLYDGDCPLCRRWVKRLLPVLEPQGFRFDTLQSCWAVARLGLNPEARPAEMIVIPAEGAPMGGGDAVIHLSKSIWWARPLVWLARLPGGRALIRRGYRDIAARRQCVGVCKIPPSPVTTRRSRREEAHFSSESGTRSVFPEDQSLLTSTPTSDVNRHSDAWLPLLLLPFITLAFQSYLPAWIFMWLLAFALFAGCKWLTFRLAVAGFQHPKPSLDRKLAYLLAWPGMDGNEFLRTENAVARPKLREWLLAVLKTLLGVLLIWRVAPMLPPAQPIIVGWTGMAGVVFILHFGLFHLLSLIWRHQGVNARPLMQAPLLATSLADFWGRRWNTAFHELVHRFCFRTLKQSIGNRWRAAKVGRVTPCAPDGGQRTARPTRRLTSPSPRRAGVAAMLLVFLISGLIHDLVISLPARGGYGLPTLYFLIQGTGLLIERTRVGRRLGLGGGWRGRIFTWLATVLPVGLLFHPPFIHQVILPMLRAIGAIAN